MKSRCLKFIGLSCLALTLTACDFFITPSSSNDESSSEVVDSEYITLNEHMLTVVVDKIYQFSYVTNYTGEVYRWTTSNSRVASISSTGLFTAKMVGSTVITIITGNNVKDKCTVTVVKPNVDGVTLNETELNLGLEETYQLEANVTPAKATNLSVTWSSNNSEVASVSDTGLVRALTEGNATISATTVDGGFVATCNVHVSYINVSNVSFNQDEFVVYRGKSSYVGYEIFPANASNKATTFTSSDTSVATVDNKGLVRGISNGTATITVKTNDGDKTDTCVVSVEDPLVPLEDLKYTYDHYNKYNVSEVDNTPSSGNSKLLVVPVWFTDSSNYISSSKKERVREDIEKAYFGTSEETGWHSVSSYYYEESHGKLNLEGVVAPWYECGKSSNSILDSDDTSQLVISAYNWYKHGYSSNMTSFDTNSNGYIDGIMLIYGAPDSQTLSSMEDNMWAYCFWIQDDSYKKVSNPGPNAYFWASYDFMYGDSSVTRYYGGNTSHCTLDAHTYIHEMGHMLGLDDYYDYSYQYVPAGGFSMQDSNVGGHDPYSIMALGWTKPYVPTESCVIEIGAFQETGDLILLSPSFSNSPFDEYILLELYTPTGLNKFDNDYDYYYSSGMGSKTSGIRIWHVDARLVNYYSNEIVTNPINNYVSHAISNTYSGGRANSSYLSPMGKGWFDYNILQLIRNSTSNSYRPTDYFSSSSLFKTGNKFSMTKYASQFVKSSKLNSGAALGYEVSFTSVTSSKAIIEIIKQ